MDKDSYDIAGMKWQLLLGVGIGFPASYFAAYGYITFETFIVSTVIATVIGCCFDLIEEILKSK